MPQAAGMRGGGCFCLQNQWLLSLPPSLPLSVLLTLSLSLCLGRTTLCSQQWPQARLLQTSSTSTKCLSADIHNPAPGQERGRTWLRNEWSQPRTLAGVTVDLGLLWDAVYPLTVT